MVHQIKNVYVEDGPRQMHCYFRKEVYSEYLVELVCRAFTGVADITMACFQEGRKLPFKGDIYHQGVHVSGTFWTKPDVPVSCCIHEPEEPVNQDTCNHFFWPSVIHQTSQSPDSSSTMSRQPKVTEEPGATVKSADKPSSAYSNMNVSRKLIHLVVFVIALITV